MRGCLSLAKRAGAAEPRPNLRARLGDPVASGLSQVRILSPAPDDKMKILKIDPRNPSEKVLREAADAINSGKLVVYPTETVYGLGADATSDETVRKVFAVKGRDSKNPTSIAVSSHEMLQKFAEVPPPAERLIKKFFPGPLTLVLHAKPGVSKLLISQDGKIGIRFPSSPVAIGLVDFSGRPITSTSANISGRPSPATAEEAVAQLGKSVDLVLDAGKCEVGVPSTVVDATSRSPRILREGAIKEKEITDAFAKP